ncbi:retrotransposable element Tf2 [Tanacetum coccineum]
MIPKTKRLQEYRRLATLKKIAAYVYWKKIRKEVKMFVKNCNVCQIFKPELVPYPGLLQPLPIPNQIWTEISMDFVDSLPMSKGKSVIMVVVDRLSKMGHFIPLSHPYTAITVAQAFLDNIYKLHGLPKIIVSDRDTVFLSRFWKELFHKLQVSLHMSSEYHPQTDGHRIIAKVGKVAYKLELPDDAQIHLVFHVS